MEPKLPAPNNGPERSRDSYGIHPEAMPSFPNLERSIERPTEAHENIGERPVQAPVQILPQIPQPVALPAPPLPVGDADVVQSVVTDAPLVANDDDLIEKEWVDKAKKIVVDTKDDPYRRELEVGKLQADYLSKRYGKELGTPQ